MGGLKPKSPAGSLRDFRGRFVGGDDPREDQMGEEISLTLPFSGTIKLGRRWDRDFLCTTGRSAW